MPYKPQALIRNSDSPEPKPHNPASKAFEELYLRKFDVPNAAVDTARLQAYGAGPARRSSCAWGVGVAA